MKGKLSMGIGAFLTIVAVLMMVNVIPDPLATVIYSEYDLTGSFYINNELATTTSTHVVYDPKLDFKFVADTGGSQVTRVHVILWDETATDTVEFEEGFTTLNLQETVTDTQWTGSATLPGPGTYTLKGRVEAFGEWTYLMSILGTWTGSEGTFTGQPTFESIQPSFGSIVLLIAGVVLLGVGVYWERES